MPVVVDPLVGDESRSAIQADRAEALEEPPPAAVARPHFQMSIGDRRDERGRGRHVARYAVSAPREDMDRFPPVRALGGDGPPPRFAKRVGEGEALQDEHRGLVVEGAVARGAGKIEAERGGGDSGQSRFAHVLQDPVEVRCPVPLSRVPNAPPHGVERGTDHQAPGELRPPAAVEAEGAAEDIVGVHACLPQSHRRIGFPFLWIHGTLRPGTFARQSLYEQHEERQGAHARAASGPPPIHGAVLPLGGAPAGS